MPPPITGFQPRPIVVQFNQGQVSASFVAFRPHFLLLAPTESMVPFSASLLEHLLHEEEGVALDFKSEQYRFVGASDEEKAELLKDVLAFANSWRRVDAYIVVGVDEVKGGRGLVTGVASHIDDAQLQQFVNSKVQRPIQFSYRPVRIDDKDAAIIHVPVQERPFYLKNNFGGLTAATVYIRRGSSTDIAKPDEIAEMGKSESAAPDISLDLFFVDPETRTPQSPELHSMVLSGLTRASIGDYRPHPREIFNPMSVSRPEYFRELFSFTRADRLLTPVHFAVRNAGGTTAHDVRLEIQLAGANEGITVMDVGTFPELPKPDHNIMIPVRKVVRPRYEPQVSARRISDLWLIEGRAEKVHPQSTVIF